MNPSDNISLHREIVRAIGAVQKDAANKPWSVIVDELSKLESELLSKTSEDNIKREILKRIEEAKISEISTLNVPIDDYELIWGRLISLGFSSFEREASMNFYRAMFYINSLGSVDRHILESLGAIEKCVNAFRASGDDRAADHFSKVHGNLSEQYRRRN